MKLDQKFQIRIDRHAARVLKETAERAGVSQSEYLRRLILARPALQPVQEMDTHTAQTKVAEAIKLRGYRKGWTPVQFLVRQVVKLQEELSELASLVTENASVYGYETDFGFAVRRAGQQARNLFDDTFSWYYARMTHETEQGVEDLKAEAADCMVVLLNVAAAIEEITGDQFDLVQAALRKARIDVPRGVRK